MKVKNKLHPLHMIFCFFMAVCLLTGCTGPGDKTQSHTEGKLPDSEPVRQLTSVKMDTMPNIVPAGEGCVLLCRTDYDVNTTYLDLVDTGSDTVKASAQRSGYQDLREYCVSDESFVLYSMDESRFYFLNRSLEEIGSFAPENPDGVFSSDRKSYYFLKEQMLFRTDLDSGETARVEMPYNLYFLSISDYSPKLDRLVLNFVISPYESDYGTAIVDLKSGELLMLQRGGLRASFSGDTVFLMGYEEDGVTCSVTYGKGGSDFQYAGSDFFRKGCELLVVDGSDCLAEVGDDTWIYRLGTEINACSLKNYGISGEFRCACWLEDSQTIVGGVFRDGEFRLYRLLLSELNFSPVAQPVNVPSPLTVSSELGNSYDVALSGGELPDSLAQARAHADQLEQRYGIRILLSSQCTQAVQPCIYTITTTDKMGFGDEQAQIIRFLKALDYSLSLYPEGFFRQFTNCAGECRIRFMPVGKLESNSNIVGVSYSFNGWYNIAVDIRQEIMEGYICHEIWHATEFKIKEQNAFAFEDNAWAELNPPDFEYHHGYDPENRDYVKWTLFSRGDEGVYFIDDYGMTNELEDRARIMEYVMTKDYFGDQMMASPAISGKLKWMCDAVRANFDTTGWQNVRWERFFSQ